MTASKPSGVWDTIKTVIYAVLIALGIRTAAFEPFNIPSGSMIPTLLVGDYLFVSKFSYGYSRYSLPLSLPLISGRVMYSQPERGDVAVFKLPSDNKTDYIKRLIGLPGDTIQMRRGRLYINGKLVPRKRIENFLIEEFPGQVQSVPQYIETLPNGRSYRILEVSDRGPLDNTEVFKVPPGHFFAMGDNRDNSLDSRVPNRPGFNGVGFVPLDNLVGRAEVMFFSTDGTAAWWEIWGWIQATRFGRLFQSVD